MTVEQMCRDLLEQAVKDRLVTFNAANFGCTAEPQQLTSGDLVGMANLLHQFIAACIRARDDRWQSAVGQPLEQAKENALHERTL